MAHWSRQGLDASGITCGNTQQYYHQHWGDDLAQGQHGDFMPPLAHAMLDKRDKLMAGIISPGERQC